MPIQQHTYEFEGGPGKIVMTARLLTQGMGFGRFDQGGWTLTQTGEKPVIEFFDRRWSHTPHGQFIARYHLESLQARERSGPSGLLLDTGSPDWAVTAQDMQDVLGHLAPIAEEHDRQRAQGLLLSLSNCGNPDRGECADRPLPEVPSDLVVPVADLQEASALARRYITAFNLGAGNWAGGIVADHLGQAVARIAYNGRVFDLQGSILEECANVGEYQSLDAEWFFEKASAPLDRSSSSFTTVQRPRNGA